MHAVLAPIVAWRLAHHSCSETRQMEHHRLQEKSPKSWHLDPPVWKTALARPHRDAPDETHVDKLGIENIRCFRSQSPVRLGRITLLVGENSSGKTTFLACLRIASKLARGEPFSFNEEPFLLGSSTEIAHYSGGRIPRAETLGLRVIVAERDEKPKIEVGASFATTEEQPTLSEFWLSSDVCRLACKKERRDRQDLLLTITTRNRTLKARLPMRLPVLSQIVTMPLEFLEYVIAHDDNEDRKFRKLKDAEREDLRIMTRALAPAQLNTYALGPVRSRPERTYDPARAGARSEGGHVPMLLAKRADAGESLTEALDSFGEAAGLFRHIKVRRYGETLSDPFQIKVQVSGHPANIVDVGYGVSQVLPILVDGIVTPRRSVLLMQQPEVHLHPRAQAELATFVAHLAKSTSKRFVIETHSDYIIDRLRMTVRDGVLSPEDISLLYFERGGSTVKIHELDLDSMANILNAPPSYRDFFLQEDRRFFGLE